MPKFIKNDLIMEVNEVCASVFVKSGWEPYVEDTAENVTEGTPLDSEVLDTDAVKANTVSDTANPKLSRREVMRMTKDALLSTAKDRGYAITADKRTEIIEEFLKLQGE